jgi:hypothetical protein
MGERVAARSGHEGGADFGEVGVEVELADLSEQGTPGREGQEEGAGSRADLDLDGRGEAREEARAAAGLDRVERKKLGPWLSRTIGIGNELPKVRVGRRVRRKECP